MSTEAYNVVLPYVLVYDETYDIRFAVWASDPAAQPEGVPAPTTKQPATQGKAYTQAPKKRGGWGEAWASKRE